jgi:SAM-dependent methyltransferase
MDPIAYRSLRDLQDRHWWFVGRRRIVTRLIERFVALSGGARILEAGCGYGGNLQMLAQFGEVDAFEYQADARAFASTRASRPVTAGALPDGIGFEDDAFDLIAMLDVLEHIDDDVASLEALRARLADHGTILLTIPAFPWLWSEHDEVHHHKRRYTKASLERVIRKAGLEPVRIGYFNTLLFPVAMAQRLASRLCRGKRHPDVLPPPLLNGALQRIFSFERQLVGRLQLPIGLSLYAIARRAEA